VALSGECFGGMLPAGLMANLFDIFALPVKSMTWQYVAVIELTGTSMFRVAKIQRISTVF
jgi:hypothetical protein